jgi:hypothetical protein
MRQVRSRGALRALAPEPALLGAAEALRTLPGRAFAKRHGAMRLSSSAAGESGRGPDRAVKQPPATRPRLGALGTRREVFAPIELKRRRIAI